MISPYLLSLGERKNAAADKRILSDCLFVGQYMKDRLSTSITS